MPLVLITAGGYDQVRKALDLGLDENALPDHVIDYSIYGPAAEADVLSQDPNAFTYQEGTGQKDRTIRAAIYMTAARLALALPPITQEVIGDYRFQQAAVDLPVLARTLRGLADREISMNTGTQADRIQQQFWLAKGRRGR